MKKIDIKHLLLVIIPFSLLGCNRKEGIDFKESPLLKNYVNEDVKKALFDNYINSFYLENDYEIGPSNLCYSLKNNDDRIVENTNSSNFMIYDYFGYFGEYEIFNIGLTNLGDYLENFTNTIVSYYYDNENMNISGGCTSMWCNYAHVDHLSFSTSIVLDFVVYNRATNKIYKLEDAIKNEIFKYENTEYEPVCSFNYFKNGKLTDRVCLY